MLCEGKKFLGTFAKRSYMSKVLTGHSDAEKLKLLDKQITDVVQNVSLSLGTHQIAMQRQQFDKLDQLADLVKKAGAGSELNADSPAVAAIAQCIGVEVREVMGQLQFSMDKMLESQDSIMAKLDAALAAGGDTCPEHLKRPPEDPKVFWDEYFDDKVVPLDLFIPVFEEEFTPEDVDELNGDEREALQDILDAYPRDGAVSIVEWKRFCKTVSKSGKSMVGFLRQVVVEKKTVA